MTQNNKAALAAVPNQLEVATYKDFDKSIVDLARRGGKFQKSANKIRAILGKASLGEEDLFEGFRTTNHGESRIDKCVKYDLGAGVRLITIQDSGVVLFCYAGTHDQCDRWLNKNRGSTLVTDQNGRIGVNRIRLVRDHETASSFEIPKPIAGQLFELIKPTEYFDRLVDSLPRSLQRELESLEVSTPDEELLAIASKIEDPELSNTVIDVFTLLKEDQCEEAVNNIRFFLGENKPIASLSPEQIAELAESDKIRKISPDEPYYPDVLGHFARHGKYMDWMLYLHPDQKTIVDRSFNGPAKLDGVSGSGKTCVIVQRAIRLARENPNEKILVLTLNRQLARLIKDMTVAATIEDVASRIVVRPLFKLCQDLLHRFEPENDLLYDDVTWKSHEHIDEIWREFYRCELNNHDAEVLLPLHDSLIARGVDAEQYIREELDWIRSAFLPNERTKYLTVQRSGRGFPLDKRYRQMLLQALGAWENKMRHVGVTDYLGLSTALSKHLDKIFPEYRFILVDEAQDLGTIELQLIRQLVDQNKDDLFLCGDATQQVQAKHGNATQAGIDLPGARSIKLSKNYRNSREILSAAYQVLLNNLTEEMLDSPDFEVLDPEYANFSGSTPLLLSANSLAEEIAYAKAYADEFIEDEPEKKCCIAVCGYSLYQIQEFGKRIGLTVLNDTVDITDDQIYLSDLEHTKGFEFDLMVIVNCNEQVLPDRHRPQNERFRDLSRFYVAMTRAKDQLVLSCSGKPSVYTAELEDRVLEAAWDEYIEQDQIKLVGQPPRLTDIRAEHEQIDHSISLLDLSGPDFLYTNYAIGLDGRLISKLRSRISGGKQRSVNGRVVPVRWNTIRDALRDTNKYPASRREFGDDDLKAFRSLVQKLEELEPELPTS
ncbi:AAA family ATPase [Marinobacteraceae bacterium S3BR75-40.1]